MGTVGHFPQKWKPLVVLGLHFPRFLSHYGSPGQYPESSVIMNTPVYLEDSMSGKDYTNLEIIFTGLDAYNSLIGYKVLHHLPNVYF